MIEWMVVCSFHEIFKGVHLLLSWHKINHADKFITVAILIHLLCHRGVIIAIDVVNVALLFHLVCPYFY